MKIRRKNHCYGKPHRDELKKGAAGLPGNAEPKRRVHRENEYQQGQSDKSPLFTDVAGDEIVVAERQKSILLPAPSKTYPEYLTGADGNQRLAKLIADFERSGSGIEERRH